MNTITFGPASWIGLVGAIAAALAPIFSELPTTWGVVVGAVLAGLTVTGRQLQAVYATKYPPMIDEFELVDEPEIVPTDVGLDAD